jgi:hypothetical protein
MIKSLPGWLNWLVYVIGSTIIASLLNLIFGWHVNTLWIYSACASVAGIYLAKWRFIQTIDQNGKIIKEEWRFW